MIKIPLTELLDEQASYEWLIKIQHPQGLHCPSEHAVPAGQSPHDRQRAPIIKYNCRECGKVFHIFLQEQTYQEAITPVVRSS